MSNTPTPKQVAAEKARHEKAARLDRFGRVLRLTDRILEPTVADVRIETSGTAPAWTDGEVIHLNASMLPVDLNKGTNISTWLGANYHELGHVLYTPRVTSPLLTRITKATQSYQPAMHNVWNMIEDQRQERLMVAQFAPLRTYLTSIVEDLIVDANNMAETWVLLAGRTWIPATVRDASREAWARVHGESSAVEVARIIGSYQRLADTGFADSDAAFTLVAEMVDLLGNSNVRPPVGCGANPTRGDGQAVETEAVDAADETPEDAPESDDGADEGTDEGEGEGDDEGDADGAGEGDEDTDTEGEGEGEGQSDEDGAPTDDETDGTQAGAAGDDVIENVSDMLEAVRDAIQDAVNNDEDVASDIKDIQDALDHGTGEGAKGATGMGSSVTPDARQGASRRDVEDAMRNIMDLVEPQHIRRTDHGKVDVRRYATADRFDASTLFNRFEAGQEDEVSVEVVILLDVSGSMGGHRIDAASAATWSVLHAVDRLEGKATVLCYNYGYTVMHRDGDRPTEDIQRPRVGGGTRPTEALNEAYRLLNESEASHRIMLSVSDGDWYDGGATVEALKDQGIITAMVHIDHAYEDISESDAADKMDRYRNGHQFFIGSASGSDIAPLFESIASEAMMGALL